MKLLSAMTPWMLIFWLLLLGSFVHGVTRADAAPMWRDPSNSYWVRFPDLAPHRGCWVHVGRTYLLFRCNDGWKERA